MIKIRRMKSEDIPIVAEIEKSIFSLPWSGLDFTKSIENLNNIYLVVEKDEQIAGYCGLGAVAGEGQINNVAVTKEFRKQGLAFIMLKELIEVGKAQGLGEFTLEVRTGNLGAIHLYHKLGFEDCGIRKNFYEAPKDDALIMWLRL